MQKNIFCLVPPRVAEGEPLVPRRWEDPVADQGEVEDYLRLKTK